MENTQIISWFVVLSEKQAVDEVDKAVETAWNLLFRP